MDLRILEHTTNCVVRGPRVNYTIIDLMVVYEHRNIEWFELHI